MKKALSVLLTLLLMLTVCAVSASADVGAPAPVEVFVTVADAAGKTVVAAQQIAVADSDSDGALTINDVLFAAHEKFYDGGAAAGYGTSVTQYGLGVTKLWGSTAGSYGYYVNNQSAWSLADPVQNGDYVAAFVYTDLVGWSDHYSYFDQFSGACDAGTPITLTYSEAGYDADWNPVTLPVEGAVITVDGEATAFTTDAEGKVTFTLSQGGVHLVSATAAGKRLVAPVYIATVTGAQEPAGDNTPDESNPDAPATGDAGSVPAVALSVMLAASAVIYILRKKYAK